MNSSKVNSGADIGS